MFEESDIIEVAKNQLMNGNAEEARLAYEAEAQKNPENSEAWLQLGKIYTENDRDDKAMQCFLKALEVDQFNVDALLNLGISCTNEFDEFDAMIHIRNWIKYHHVYNKYFDKSNILLDYEIIKAEMRKETEEDYYSKAQRIEVLKKNFYNEMLNMMEIIAKEHTDVDLWIALGIGHYIPHNYDRAINCFRQAVLLNPKDYNAWNKLGAMLAHSKMNDEAINTYKKALELKPNYARCWANLGIAYFNVDNYNDATDCFVNALKIYDIPHVWGYLNSVLIATGKSELSEYIYKRDLNGLLSKLSFK